MHWYCYISWECTQPLLQYQCMPLKKLDMKGWTHFSSWRLWFTCKAAANSGAPSTEMWFQLRLQNVRKQEMRGWFNKPLLLCVRYIWSQYLTTETQHQTLYVSLSISQVEHYKHITMTTCRNDHVTSVRNNRTLWENIASATTPSP